MPSIQLIMTGGDGAFADVKPEKLGHTTLPIRICVLENGMQSGLPSVSIGVFLPNDGGCVIAETSLGLFLSAADALKAKYGDPR